VLRESIALTQARVRDLPTPEAGQPIVYDAVIPGLAVRLSPGGTKTFILYRKIKGRPRRITIGRFPAVTVERARQLAQKMSGKIADGIDPDKERRQYQATRLTLSSALKEYRDSRESALRPKTLSEYERMFNSYLTDWLTKPAVEITRDMVETRHAKVTEGHGPGAANHCMRALRAVLNYVGDKYEGLDGRSILPDNPVRRLTAVRAWNRIARRRTVLADREIPQWHKGLVRLKRTFPAFADLFMLCFVTGTRPGEASSLQIDRIDLKFRTFEVEDTKNREPLLLPITDEALKILSRRIAALPRDTKYVFPGTGKTEHLVEWKKATRQLRKLSKLPNWIVYDLRRTYLTCAESLGLPPYAMKALVNHKQPGGDVTGGYLKLTPSRLREPAQQVENALLRMARPSISTVEQVRHA
jgi:integrase